MKEEASTVEVTFFDTGLFGAFGNCRTHLGRGFDIVPPDNAKIFFQRRGCRQSYALHIVDQLNADVLVRAVNGKPGLVARGFPKFVPYAQTAAQKQYFAW